MDSGEVQPLVAWARLLSSDPDTALPEDAEALLTAMAGGRDGLRPVVQQIERLSSLSSAALSEVLASDHRPQVRLALLSQPRLSVRDRRTLVGWAYDSEHRRQLSGVVRLLPFRRAVELYSLVREREPSPYAARLLVEHLFDYPSRGLARFEELLLLADRGGDSVLMGELMRWARAKGRTVPLERLSYRLSPAGALDLLSELLGRDYLKLTAPRAKRLVELLEACGGDHPRLLHFLDGDIFDFCPTVTPKAVDVLVASGVPLLLRLASRGGDEVGPQALAGMLSGYPIEHLQDLTYLLSDSPQLWSVYRTRIGQLPAPEQRDLLDSLFTDVVRCYRDVDPVPTPVKNALATLSLDLLGTDRSLFWSDPSTVTYLVSSSLAPASWWAQAAPTPDEAVLLLEEAICTYDYDDEGFPEPLPSPFEELLWQAPGIVERLGRGLLAPELLLEHRDSFRHMLLRRLQLFFAGRLGTDQRAWEVVLSLASEFDGSAVELVDTALALS